ncbi:MAG: hypothetical protein PHV53_07575 [Fermentimonas sp.]|nr:hypothetical protein [Fermentimonas sp.]
MYIFNPEHDLALANFRPYYTPPTSAIRLATDLAVLPVWYSGEVTVIADGEVNRKFLEAVKSKLQLSAGLIPYADIAQRPNKIIPWGWNPALCKRLMSHGVPESQLPTIEDLQLLRDYSNRKNAVQLLKELKLENSDFCGDSHYFQEISELLSYLQSTPGNKVLKMPVSGSGKGLIWILGEITDKQTDWCRRVIKTQGGVVAEPVLNKVVDFAMEFYLEKGFTEFRGYSLFHSASSGAYLGNELISDEKAERKLAEYVSKELLQQLKKLLKIKLTEMFPAYNGYAGVDMMISSTDEVFRIQPCVEVNMRMNMGVVSRLFHNQYMYPECEGRFVVDFFKKPGYALKFHEKMQQESPLKVNNGKIVSGYLSLTPVTSDTHYVVHVTVK